MAKRGNDMATRTAGIGAGWRWLMGAINLGSRNAGAIFGAAALILMAGLVPSILQAVAQAGGQSPLLAVAVMVVVVAYLLFVLMPLGAGFYRLIQASEAGQPARATSIFGVFGDHALVLRVVGLGVALMLLGFIISQVMKLLLGTDFIAGLAGWMQALETMDPENPVLSQAPEGLGLFMALALLFGIFFSGVYMIAFGQVALGGRRVVAALTDGFVGTFRNVLPLALLALLCVALGVIALVVFVLVAGVLILVGNMVSPLLGMVLLLPIYLALLLVIYVIGFGVGYYMWRDVCSGPDAAPGDGHSVTL